MQLVVQYKKADNLSKQLSYTKKATSSDINPQFDTLQMQDGWQQFDSYIC